MASSILSERKKCCICHKTKSVSDFHKAPKNKGGLESKCKACKDISLRKSHLRNRYGVTEEEYEQLLKEQGNVCAVCGMYSLRRRSKYMVVDHDHLTNKVRGILCHKCNTALGLMDDSVEKLTRAIKYLEKNIE